MECFDSIIELSNLNDKCYRIDVTTIHNEIASISLCEKSDNIRAIKPHDCGIVDLTASIRTSTLKY